MAYTPELSYQSSCTLRRIAWAWGVPMTKAIDRVFEKMVAHLDRAQICERCRDKTRCDECSFSKEGGPST